MVLLWVFLFAVINGSFGKMLGIPFLFLDVEYLGTVNFTSFFIVGISLGGFTMAYHMTGYILDGPMFGFLGSISKPFSKFALNNAFIPLTFLANYALAILFYQLNNEYVTLWQAGSMVSGLVCGYFMMMALLFIYIRATNIDAFKVFADSVDKQLKKSPFSRGKIMQKLSRVKKPSIHVDTYLDLNLTPQPVNAAPRYDKSIVLKVFDQNHLNLALTEALIFVSIMVMGRFSNLPVFQIPAAASVLVFLTMIIMFFGVVAYWVRGWTTSLVIVLFFIFNFAVKHNFIGKTYKAFGLDYHAPLVSYSDESLQKSHDDTTYHRDYQRTINTLNKWKQKHVDGGTGKPKMAFVCTSGGGLRAATWTMRVMQVVDSATRGGLMNHTQLITGASGGIMGASFYRELMIRETPAFPREGIPVVKAGNNLSRYNRRYWQGLANDALNPVIFSLVVNDLFFQHSRFTYNEKVYNRARGYAFEQQLSRNTFHFLDKPLKAYADAEANARVPMVMLAPTIVNDGRKLYISPHSVSYMCQPTDPGSEKSPLTGVDFTRMFAQHQARELRFLSALRMSATFPYVTPNVTLPSSPAIEIMDSGISDNFGISDAIQFMNVFKEWISKNTSGVVFMVIRDSRQSTYHNKPGPGISLLQRTTGPLKYIYNNLFNIQTINNNEKLANIKMNSAFPVDVVRFELSVSGTDRPSLSWRLTGKEKQSIYHDIDNHRESVKRIQQLLNHN